MSAAAALFEICLVKKEKGEIRKGTEQSKSAKVFAIQGLKKLLLSGDSLLSDIPSHFNLGKG